MARGQSDKDYPLLERMMYLFYMLENARMVKDLLIRTNSICSSCPYKQNGEVPCKENELCNVAMYSYLFHGDRNVKLKSGRDKINRWITEVNKFFENYAKVEVIKRRKGPQNVQLAHLAYPVPMVFFHLYHGLGERISFSWFIDFDIKSGAELLLAWLAYLAKKNKVIKKITISSIESERIVLNLALSTHEETNLEIELQDYSPSNFQYRVRWYLKKTEGEFNILRWDNHHDVGRDTAPHHVHIHGNSPILPWKYHSSVKELIECVITFIKQINEKRIDLDNKKLLEKEVQDFNKC